MQPDTTTHSVALADVGSVDLTVTEWNGGSAQTFLLLHGGAGPQSVAGFAALLGERLDARVLAVTHPGFGGTTRPDALRTPRALGALYAALLDQLDLHDVTIVGNSIGGWIAPEIALANSRRIKGIVLVDAVGISVEGHPIADVFSLTLPQLMELSYHAPNAFRIAPSTFTDAQRAVAAGNRATLAVYGGAAMIDPTLEKRLGDVRVPALVVWGEADRVATPTYGRAVRRRHSRRAASSCSPRPGTSRKSRRPRSCSRASRLS